MKRLMQIKKLKDSGGFYESILNEVRPLGGVIDRLPDPCVCRTQFNE